MVKGIQLTDEQIAYIVEKTAIQDKKAAIEYFAEVMLMESIHPSDMQLLVKKMMRKDRKKR